MNDIKAGDHCLTLPHPLMPPTAWNRNCIARSGPHYELVEGSKGPIGRMLICDIEMENRAFHDNLPNNGQLCYLAAALLKKPNQDDKEFREFWREVKDEQTRPVGIPVDWVNAHAGE